MMVDPPQSERRCKTMSYKLDIFNTVRPMRRLRTWTGDEGITEGARLRCYSFEFLSALQSNQLTSER